MTVENYITTLEAKAVTVPPMGRFYLWADDDELWHWEQDLCEDPVFYPALVTLYRRWKDEMGDAAWADLLAYNGTLNGANQNGILSDW